MLSDTEKKNFLETLTPEQLDEFIQILQREEYLGNSRETELTNAERRRIADAADKARKRAAESTVNIPWLTDAERNRREQLEADNEAWIWEMCGPKSGILEPLTRAFTEQQSQMIFDYAETLRHGGDLLLLASRGEGKTTYLRCMTWKAIATGMVDFIAFISATGSDAVNSANAIKDMMIRSEPFFRYYPEIAVPVARVGSTPQLAHQMRANGVRMDNDKPFTAEPIKFSWTTDEIDMPAVPGAPSCRAMMRFRGADSPIRGLNILGRRPKAIVADDLDTPDTTGNTEVAKKIIDRVNLDIGGLGGQDKSLGRIMLATLPKSGVGVAHHFARHGHPFVVKRFRYLIEKPDRFDLWMEYVRLRQKGKVDGDKYGRVAHAFYLKNEAEMNAGALVSNKDRFKPQLLEDGSQLQVSALQNYFDEWADKGEMFCRCELDNETIENEDRIESKLEMGHVMASEQDYDRLSVDRTTSMIVRAVDVRKIELHFSVLAVADNRSSRVVDYDVKAHGTTETTVEQAEQLIYDGLCRLAEDWATHGYDDQDGQLHQCDLTLIDKGWMGSWSEDGERKTWVSQPVERFCMEHGLRRWLPAKGAPNYRSPAPSDNVIVGDNWHMNRGEGAERACTEVIWNSEHWHGLVSGLFLLPNDDPAAFTLFRSCPGVWHNHKRLAEHIREGADELAELRRRATRSRKPKYRRDHWWDSFAMMLVARSIEQWFRENLVTKKKQPQRQYVLSHSSEELGAR